MRMDIESLLTGIDGNAMVIEYLLLPSLYLSIASQNSFESPFSVSLPSPSSAFVLSKSTSTRNFERLARCLPNNLASNFLWRSHYWLLLRPSEAPSAGIQVNGRIVTDSLLLTVFILTKPNRVHHAYSDDPTVADCLRESQPFTDSEHLNRQAACSCDLMTSKTHMEMAAQNHRTISKSFHRNHTGIRRDARSNSISSCS
jgi:hypothetical protein